MHGQSATSCFRVWRFVPKHAEQLQNWGINYSVSNQLAYVTGGNSQWLHRVLCANRARNRHVSWAISSNWGVPHKSGLNPILFLQELPDVLISANSRLSYSITGGGFVFYILAAICWPNLKLLEGLWLCVPRMSKTSITVSLGTQNILEENSTRCDKCDSLPNRSLLLSE
jgi:hypothetical protein